MAIDSTNRNVATQILETSGPTTLDIAGIADGTFVKRVGSLLVGVSVTGGGGGGGGVAAPADPLDVPPASPSAYDDEFETTSLDAKWTKNPIVTANALTITVGDGRLRFGPSNYAATGKRLYGIAQVETGGSSFKIWAKLSSVKAGTAAYNGLIVGRSAGGVSSAHVWGSDPNSSNALATMAAVYNEGGTDWSAFDAFNNSTSPSAVSSWRPVWYRIRWDAAGTTLYFDFSTDGDQWINQYSHAAMSQPDRIGFGMYATSAPAGWATDAVLNARCFRYEANSAF